MAGEDPSRELARLRWQCRRGMLELDEILDGYLTCCYQQADAAEQAAFRQLLTQQDPQLQQWLLLGNDPDDAGLLGIVRRLRES
jgi:antitoxin CptB